MEEDWQGQEGGGRVRPLRPTTPRLPRARGRASHLSFSFRKRSSCSSSMFISMGLKYDMMVRKSSKFISSASPDDSCRRFLPRAEPLGTGEAVSPSPHPSPQLLGPCGPSATQPWYRVAQSWHQLFPQDSASISIISSLAPSQPLGTGALKPALSIPHAGAGPSPPRGARGALTACQKRHGRFWP